MKHKLLIGCLLLLVLVAATACSDSNKIQELESKIDNLTSELQAKQNAYDKLVVDNDKLKADYDVLSKQLQSEIDTAQDYINFAEQAIEFYSQLTQIRNDCFSCYYNYEETYEESPFKKEKLTKDEANSEMQDFAQKLVSVSSRLEVLYAPSDASGIKAKLLAQADETGTFIFSYRIYINQLGSGIPPSSDRVMELQDIEKENYRALLDLKLKYQHILDRLQE